MKEKYTHYEYFYTRAITSLGTKRIKTCKVNFVHPNNLKAASKKSFHVPLYNFT